MKTHKILSLLAFLFFTSGCTSLSTDLMSNSGESTYSTDLVEKTDVDDALPNSSVDCVPKTGSLFGFSRTCKKSSSLFSNFIPADKIDSSTDTVIRNIDQKSPQNCKIKENTLFGLSRTCESSDALSKSLSN